jgi:hypothetical protein
MMWNVLYSLKLGSTCSIISKCELAQNMVRMYQKYIYVLDVFFMYHVGIVLSNLWEREIVAENNVSFHILLLK